MDGAFHLSTPGGDDDAGAPAPSRADAVRNRARVLSTTIDMLRSKGADVSVDEIARAAGVGAGTVVRSFGGKQKLIDCAVAELLRPVVEQSRAAAQSPQAHVWFASGGCMGAGAEGLALRVAGACRCRSN